MKHLEKILSVCIYGLFLSSVLYPLSFDVLGNTVLNKTIYVDDENIQGPWDGSEEHPFQHIQNAIDAASDGDMIFVYSGIYYESIIANKSLCLVGENRNTTIIDGGSNNSCILITNTIEVSVSNFFIDNVWYSDNAGIIITNAHQNLIFNNVFNRSLYGIKLSKTSNNSVFNNVFNNDYGLNLRSGAKYNKIYENLITGGPYGIFLYGDDVEHNLICNNEIKNNKYGIYGQYSNNNTIEYNLLESWGFDIFFDACGYNLIHRNDAKIVHINGYDNYISNNSKLSFFRIDGFNNIVEYNVHNFGDARQIIDDDEYISDKEGRDNLIINNIINRCFIRGNSHIIYNQIGEIYIENSEAFVEKNNIEGAGFEYRLSNFFSSSFRDNYWFQELNRPKFIHGNILIVVVIIPNWLEFHFRVPIIKSDMSPANEPYDIPGGGGNQDGFLPLKSLGDFID